MSGGRVSGRPGVWSTEEDEIAIASGTSHRSGRRRCRGLIPGQTIAMLATMHDVPSRKRGEDGLAHYHEPTLS